VKVIIETIKKVFVKFVVTKPEVVILMLSPVPLVKSSSDVMLLKKRRVSIFNKFIKRFSDSEKSNLVLMLLKCF
jgi:hypothetical protein